jgi:ABC-2 type transport system ATP-binding protein
LRDTLVSFVNVSKNIGKRPIIKDVSFNIRKGEILGFLGPNGAGKTTIMSMLLGLVNNTSGEIYINDIKLEKNLCKALNYIGGVIESPVMYKYLTGYKNLCLYSRMYKNVSKDRVDQIVEILNMNNYINKKVKNFSLGMKQRLGLAQALLHSPELLVLDEPFNGLDPVGIKEFKSHLRKLATSENATVFISSHILAEMENLCDRVIIINNGSIVTIDTIKNLKNNFSETKMLLDVDNIEKSLKIIKEIYPQNKIFNKNDLIEIDLSNNDLPKLVSNLVSSGVVINGVNKKYKSLEEIFIEMIGGKST